MVFDLHGKHQPHVGKYTVRPMDPMGRKYIDSFMVHFPAIVMLVNSGRGSSFPFAALSDILIFQSCPFEDHFAS